MTSKHSDTSNDLVIKDGQIRHKICQDMTIQLYSGKNSVQNILERRAILSTIINEFEDTGKPYTKVNLLTKLKERGYDIHWRTLHRDLTELNKSNTFVLDIAQKTYSYHLDENFKRLEFIMNGLDDIINTKWTNSKTIQREIPSENGNIVMTEKVTTPEIAEPKLKAYALQKEIIALKFRVFEGDIIDTSVALMLKEFQKIKALNASLEAELENTRRKIS